jgi:hypothetical protein
MLIVLFFKCMITLFNPVHRRGEGIKWGLASYTVIMFSLVTVYTMSRLHIFSISYIDNRNFPAGPYRYLAEISYGAIGRNYMISFRLNNWLADGLLLYRCYLFYSANLWAITFPCLIYFASVAIGTLSIVYPQIDKPYTAYISLSLSLNVLLTFMVVARLVLYSWNVRAATGSPTGTSGVYKSVATMLIESSALFAVSSLLVIVLWAIDHPVVYVFTHILAQTQVIASLLIIQRVANKSALTSSATASGSRGQGGLAGGSGTLPGGHPMRFETSVSEFRVGTGTVDTCSDKV